MKRATLLLFAALAVLAASPLTLHAQVLQPVATPTPDPMVYSDPAMSFRAPDGFVAVGKRQIDVSKLGEDPEIVAGWLYPNKDHPRRLYIQQEYFEGNVHDFDGVYEEQVRGQFDNALFKNKQDISLKNGMPAMFMEMTSGEGFGVQKMYILIWADTQRGVAIVLQTQLGDLDANAARALISDASAVRYPVERQ
jgi:hypothetical protein